MALRAVWQQSVYFVSGYFIFEVFQTQLQLRRIASVLAAVHL